MKKKSTAFLDPSRTLVAAFTDELVKGDYARSRSGAVSFSHLMVVVPTAQSGRRLRLELADRFEGRGVLPPLIVQPKNLLCPAEDLNPEGSPLMLQAFWLEFVADCSGELKKMTHLFPAGTDFGNRSAMLGFFDQLASIWNILGRRGLLMREVPEQGGEVLEQAAGDEAERWNELAVLEQSFFKRLESAGISHPAQRIHAAAEKAAPPPEGIETVLLPALSDALPAVYDVLEKWSEDIEIKVLLHADGGEADKFDAWGRPLIEQWTGEKRPDLSGKLRDEDIIVADTDRELGMMAAENFPLPASGLEPPALGLADAGIYVELESAFLNRGIVLSNPERYRLSVSSLGRLSGLLLDWWEAVRGGIPVPWKVFSALLRSSDVMNAVLENAPAGTDRAAVLAQADDYQRRNIPAAVPSEFGAGDSALRFVSSVLKEHLSGGSADACSFLRSALKWIFSVRTVGSRTAEDREFAAAADMLGTVMRELDEVMAKLPAVAADVFALLLRRSMDNTGYQLEDDDRDCHTDGWLELVWTPRSRIILAGMHEGAVPETVTGHDFLPESLRRHLGLGSNEQRLARDTFLLSEMLRARNPGDVAAYVSGADDAGDIHRPSRLLFLCSPKDLPRRAEQLFGGAAEPSKGYVRYIADGWKLKLPSVENVTIPEHLSASAIDSYLKSPFCYYLNYILGMNPVEERQEFGFDDIGTFVHKVLETYAGEQMAKTAGGGKQIAEAAEIRASLERIAEAEIRRHIPCSAGLRMQLEAMKRRLADSAELQAGWAADGWEIYGAEYKLGEMYGRTVKPFNGLDLTLHGSVDRIDRRKTADGGWEYRIIDYKTWDKCSITHLFAGGGDALEFAETRGLPVVCPTRGDKRFISVQLPLYRRALELLEPERFGGRIVDTCYLVLGKNSGEIKAWGGDYLRDFYDAAVKTAAIAARQMTVEKLFWPVGMLRELEFVHAPLFMNGCDERELPAEWLDDQLRRLEKVQADFHAVPHGDAGK